jgi:hypothetical protein
MRLNPQMVEKAIAQGRARQTRRKFAARGGLLTAVAASAVLIANFLGQTPKIPALGPTQAESTQTGGTATAATSAPTLAATATPESGDRMRKDIVDQEGNKLHIDAAIPDYSNQRFPAAAISPKKFSQEQAEAIIQVLVGDSYFYDATTMTVSQINDQIAFYTQKLKEATEQKTKDLVQGFINQYKAMLKDAPTDDAIPPASRVFKKVKVKGAADKEEIVGEFKKGDQTFTLFIDNYDNDGELSEVDMNAVGGMSCSIIARAADATPDQDPGIPYEQAKAQAIKLAQDMGSGLTLADSFLGREDSEDRDGPTTTRYFYNFEFTRAVNGVVTQYDETCLSAPGTEEENNKPNAKQPWPYELLTVTIDSQGVFSVQWKSPSKVDSVLNDNVPILPIEQVTEQNAEKILKNSLMTGTLNGVKGKVVLNVNKITLSLARLQSGDKYTLIPVWDFYGTVEYLKQDGTPFFDGQKQGAVDLQQSLTSLLTVNATDGSIINRSLGLEVN